MKADLSAIYIAPTPEPYLEHLTALGYTLPDRAAERLRSLVRALTADGRSPVRIVDLCASYAIVPALLAEGETMASLRARWSRIGDLGARPAGEPVDVHVVDSSAPAMAFAADSGLCDRATCADLRASTLPPALEDDLQHMDLCTVIGGLGYIGPAVFERVLESTAERARRPLFFFGIYRVYWPAALVSLFEARGYATVRVGDDFPGARDFVDADERAAAVAAARAAGLDPAGLEADGAYAGRLFMAVPRSEADRWRAWVAAS